MATYHIEPSAATLHGRYSRDIPPVLTIASGDTVIFKTLDAGWGIEPHAYPGADRRMFEPRDRTLDKGHALCGPVAIRGAEPGMTLQIDINEVRPGPFGATYAGGWPHEVNERFGILNSETSLLWTLDPDTMTGRDQHGHVVALRPFLGVIGMPPAEPGNHPTAPPRNCGGNIDCKELVAGTTLYLPISVPGALVSAGDGHAAQGDGEVSVTAIECPMERVSLTFRLLDDMPLKVPRARTAEGWLTLAFHEDLNEATFQALDAMLDLISEQHGMSRIDALAMASVVVDLRITQIANGVKGVHAVLPDGSIRKYEV